MEQEYDEDLEQNELYDDVSESNDDVERLQDIAEKTSENYKQAFLEAENNSDLSIVIDGIVVYVNFKESLNGKTSFEWFTLHKIEDNQRNELEKHLRDAMGKVARGEFKVEGANKWSLRKQFSRIYSAIGNTLKRFFRT